MSTATFQEPLRAVPPAEEMKERFSAFLVAKEAAHRAFDAILSVPREAAGFVARLFTALPLPAPLRWLARARVWIVRSSRWTCQQFGHFGVVSAVGAVVTSSTGQAVMRRTRGLFGRVAGWVGRSTYRAINAGLRAFGRPGSRAADALFAFAVRLSGLLSPRATSVVDRIGRLTDPGSDHVRLLAGVCRGYLLHRLGQLIIRNRWVRVIIEAFVVPALANSRVPELVGNRVREVRDLVASRRDQRRILAVVSEEPDTRATEQTSTVGDYQTSDDRTPAVGASEAVPQPASRAERRALQREQARRRHHPAHRPSPQAG